MPEPTAPLNAGSHAPFSIAAINPAAPDAQQLIRELNDETLALDPAAAVDALDISEFPSAGGYFVVVIDSDHAVGCGGFRRVNDRFAELKRLFTRPPFRRRGMARQILTHLEDEARRRGFRQLILETRAENTAAIALFTHAGYLPIRAFRGDAGLPQSRCYAKDT
jgi:putative acetyltransferase